LDNSKIRVRLSQEFLFEDQSIVVIGPRILGLLCQVGFKCRLDGSLRLFYRFVELAQKEIRKGRPGFNRDGSQQCFCCFFVPRCQILGGT
jgi:hypothetical protein